MDLKKEMYFKDIEPFPTNITSEELTDFYVKINPEKNYYDFSIDAEEKHDKIYDEIFKKYMNCYFSSLSCFLTIQDGFYLLEEAFANNSKTNILQVLNEFNIDLTHLRGMCKDDLQAILIPFEEVSDLKMFGDIVEYKVEYWCYGKIIGCNY